MQQTEKYQLNLIERTDPFSPEALNQNTQKVENVLSAALAGETAAREEDVSVLDARVTALEAHHIYVGTYIGNGNSSTGQIIHLGFDPAAILILPNGPYTTFLLTRFTPFPHAPGTAPFEFVDGGFRVRYVDSYWNNLNRDYAFVALV